MKKLNLILLLLLSATDSIFAQTQRGAIQVRLNNNNLLTLVVDGRHFRKYGNSLTVGDLPAGMHNIKVYQFYPANDSRYSNFRDNHSHAVLAYKGRMQIVAGTMYYCIVDASYKSMKIRESRTLSLDNTERNFPINTESVFSDDQQTDLYSEDDTRRDRRRDNQDNVLSYYSNSNLITAAQMVTLKDAVYGHISSADKVSVIEQYVSGKALVTDQVLTMMDWLSFESDRLRIAKSCYPLVLDQENYLQVDNKLTFQSSKRELETMMAAQKNTTNNTGNWTDEDRKDAMGNSGILQQGQLNLLGKSVAEKITDTDKEKFMQEYLGNYTFSTAQVASMLDWLTFEGSKLEFAKWSYAKVSDKDHFGLLKKKFNFSSSRKSIDDLAVSGR